MGEPNSNGFVLVATYELQFHSHYEQGHIAKPSETDTISGWYTMALDTSYPSVAKEAKERNEEHNHYWEHHRHESNIRTARRID